MELFEALSKTYVLCFKCDVLWCTVMYCKVSQTGVNMRQTICTHRFCPVHTVCTHPVFTVKTYRYFLLLLRWLRGRQNVYQEMTFGRHQRPGPRYPHFTLSKFWTISDQQTTLELGVDLGRAWQQPWQLPPAPAAAPRTLGTRLQTLHNQNIKPGLNPESRSVIVQRRSSSPEPCLLSLVFGHSFSAIPFKNLEN